MGCLFGHVSGAGVFNAGLVLGWCDRCEWPIVKAPGGRWHQVPRGYGIVWREIGWHAAPPRELLALARRHAPLLHRMRRTTSTRFYVLN